MSDYLIERSEDFAEQYKTTYFYAEDLLMKTNHNTSEDLTLDESVDRMFKLRTYVVESSVQIEMLTEALKNEQNKTIIQRIKNKLKF